MPATLQALLSCRATAPDLTGRGAGVEPVCRTGALPVRRPSARAPFGLAGLVLVLLLLAALGDLPVPLTPG